MTNLLFCVVGIVCIAGVLQLETPAVLSPVNCALRCPCILPDLCSDPSPGGDTCHQCKDTTTSWWIGCRGDCSVWDGAHHIWIDMGSCGYYCCSMYDNCTSK
jgi:hypothetical protein